MLAPFLLLLGAADLPTRTLDSLLDEASRPRGGTAAACVIRVRDGAVLWERDAWRRLLPASTQKVLAAAVLRPALGPATRLSTRLVSPVAPRGTTLPGDLVLEAAADPAFGRGADSSALDSLAAGLARRGVRTVGGDLVVRDPFLKSADRPWPGSWDWDNSLADCDGAPSAGISLDGNCPGDVPRTHPHRDVAAALRRRLASRGVKVRGSDRFELGGPSRGGQELSSHASAPLDSLLRAALWASSNHDFETLGLRLGDGDTLSARRGALRRLRRELAPLGLDTALSEQADLCGLSRKDLIAAGTMARVLAAIARDPARDVFPLLPAPGEGTLKGRMKGLPAGTSLRAKTGSLDGVSALVGRLVPPGGDTLVFALFFNGHAGPAAPVRAAQDRIVVLLAGGTPPPPDTLRPPARPDRPPRPRPAFLSP